MSQLGKILIALALMVGGYIAYFHFYASPSQLPTSFEGVKSSLNNSLNAPLNSLSNSLSNSPPNKAFNKKCIGQDGRVYYGALPDGVRCVQNLAMEGNLTVIDGSALLENTAKSVRSAKQPYRCDGRTRCSQMTSCDEAIYFLRACPGVIMDGNKDGIPCETQWCG